MSHAPNRHTSSMITMLCLITLATITAATHTAHAATVIHVDDDAPAGGDGVAWATAYAHLQDALAAATAGGGTCEIRVAQGTYRPDRTDAIPAGTGDRLATFQLIDDVSILGGYAGVGAPDPDARDHTQFITVLSGDLAADDGPAFANNGENSRHVTTASANNDTAVLDGVTITAGNATGTPTNPDRFGAGMLCQGGDPVVRHCRFVANTAEFGGGVLNDASGEPTFVDCAFEGNVGLQQAGGVHTNSSGGEPTFINCAFRGNSGGGTGGGIHVRFNATLLNCVFSGNDALRGGGIYAIAATPLVVNCTFDSNTASTAGGASSNQSGGGSINTEFHNCIMWNNVPDDIDPPGGNATVRNSNVTGWIGPGSANIDADPLFIDALGPDLTAGTGDEDLSLGVGSPSIDTGSNAFLLADLIDADGDGDFLEPFPFDFALNPRVIDGDVDTFATIDMGALEFFIDCNDNGVHDPTEIASGASQDCNENGIPDMCDIADGTSEDCNRDGIPDECVVPCPEDLSGNGVVDFADVLAVLSAWGACR